MRKLRKTLSWLTYVTAITLLTAGLGLAQERSTSTPTTDTVVATTTPAKVEGQVKTIPLASTTKSPVKISKPVVKPKPTLEYYSVSASYLNVRQQPSKSTKIVDVLVKSYTVQAKRVRNTNWFELSTGGFVSGHYLTKLTVTTGKQRLADQAKKPKPKPTFAKKVTAKPAIARATKQPKATATSTPVATTTTGQPSLTLTSPSNLSAAHFDALLANTALAGIGSSLVAVEQQYQINGLFTLAVARLESGNGTSRIARDKNNLFGMNAVDGNAYNAAFSYPSKHASIMDFGDRMRRNYFNQGLTTLPTINKKYSSSSAWQQKVHSIMVSDLNRAQ